MRIVELRNALALHRDPFLVLADYRTYVDCQAKVSAAWQHPDTWSHMSILNTARSGKFSSPPIGAIEICG